MTKILWIADELRAAGLDVYEMPGWETSETRSYFEPEGVVCHHTATSRAWLDGHVALLLRRGRRDLTGPLSQLGLERDGTFVTVAAGRCNHNGYGRVWGNDAIGIEAYNDGVGEPWPSIQMDAYEAGVAVICKHYDWSLAHVLGHKETTYGKIDPTFNMNNFRAGVGGLLIPSPSIVKDDDMYLLKQKRTGYVWLVEPGRRTLIGGANYTSAAKVFPQFEADDPTFERLIKDRNTYQ